MISPNEILDFSENDWGFYIDLENIKQTIVHSENTTIKKQYNCEYDYFKEIDEEYQYYVKNYDENDNDTNIFSIDIESDCKNSITHTGIKYLFLRISSTTVITAFLTYIIFCIL
jgi:hypothetical protein